MVGLRPKHGITRSLVGGIEARFVRIAVPTLIPRHAPVAEGEMHHVYLEELIGVSPGELFPSLQDVLLPAYLRDNVKARLLRPDGSYEREPVAPDEPRLDSQLSF